MIFGIAAYLSMDDLEHGADALPACLVVAEHFGILARQFFGLGDGAAQVLGLAGFGGLELRFRAVVASPQIDD